MLTQKNDPSPSMQRLNKSLHPKNLHQHGYDFDSLIKCYPSLKPFVAKNIHGNMSIDFAEPNAIKALNSALLQHVYGITDWRIPVGYLCPPIPGRVDYIHYIADLLNEEKQKTEADHPIRLLDIGTGANGIYPLLASKVYRWYCVASDIDPH